VFPKRSQYGRITALADPKLWDAEEGVIHFIGWKNSLIKRVCRSTFRAETHAMIYATEASDKIRAIITDLRGKYQKQNWEAVSAQEVPSVWMTDCQSLSDYLVNPTANGSEDKRSRLTSRTYVKDCGSTPTEA
jgi:hypothetical protein